MMSDTLPDDYPSTECTLGSIDAPFQRRKPSLSITLDDVNPPDVQAVTPCSLDFRDDSHYDEYDGYDLDEDIENRDDNIHVYTYPSGRLPLIPIDANDDERNRRNHSIERKDSNRKKEVTSNNTSWLSKTFCALPSNATLDTVGELSNDEIVILSPFDESVCVISDDESVVVDDELNVNVKKLFCLDTSHTSPCKTRGECTDWRQHSPGTFDDAYDVLLRNRMICNSWQNWYDDEDMEKLKIHQSIPNCYVTNRPHNSSIDLSSKKKRIQYLRRSMAPFAVDQVGGETHDLIELTKKTNSFSHANVPLIRKQPQTRSFQQRTGGDYEWHSKIIESCGNFNQIQEIEIIPSFETKWEHDNENLCYDSDPTDILPSRQSFKRPRSQTFRKEPRMYDSSYDEGETEIYEDSLYAEKVCEHMTTKRIMVWHKESKLSASEPPVAVHAWIEYGSQLHSALIQPKFCWQEANRKETQIKSVFKNSLNFHAVDLLDISKVMPMENIIDRDRHPFAKLNSSFLIEAFGGCQQMVFEARDEGERDDIIEGLKLIVARLGSKIIVGDSSVLNEFFTPLGGISVPGAVPSILT